MLDPNKNLHHEFPDRPTTAHARGRGSQINPGNRFEDVRLHVLGEERDRLIEEQPNGVQIGTQVFDDDSKSIINPVDSPDLSFSWTINPYRGCEHGCIYCYARPGHEYLGLSSGLDFETKIFAKREAPEMLRKELAKASWKGEPIVMSGVTDPYQPIERELEITRGCLKVMAECGQAVSIITKNKLVLRDLDLLSKLHAVGAAKVAVSLTTLDPRVAAVMEPRASSPKGRLEAIRELSRAGIPVAVMTAPIVPNINDHEIPALLEAAAEAGATSAGWILLRLPHQIKAIFLEWVERNFPGRAAHVESLIRQARDGELYDAAWFSRQRGQGAFADQIAATFKVFARRYGLDQPRTALNTKAFVRPSVDRGQLGLFDR